MKVQVYQGYAWYSIPDHPRSNSGKVKRSVLVLEKKLGRPLRPGEMVHHIDGDRLNDHPDNLESTTRSKHMRDHIPVEKWWERRRPSLEKRKKEARKLWNEGWNSTQIIEKMRIGHNTLKKYLGGLMDSHKKRARKGSHNGKTRLADIER